MMRLSVPIEDGVRGDVHELPRNVADLRKSLHEVLETSAIDDRARLLTLLTQSLDHLGDDPSTSAVLREAVNYFVHSVREAEHTLQMEHGYAALRYDQDRAEGLGAMRDRLPARFDED